MILPYSEIEKKARKARSRPPRKPHPYTAKPHKEIFRSVWLPIPEITKNLQIGLPTITNSLIA